ncbi:hypothetical protein C4K37_0137 [Pseudomonas chlororaphis subsp. piscium]|nr:hypothetical protein C4K37_0137 [Pseudomonas chlororaphis subsp. piscium]AZC41094.1 hypothetical protein C4K36_0137 [Pseudomonas chlororaphis subsp. piscium]
MNTWQALALLALLALKTQQGQGNGSLTDRPASTIELSRLSIQV